MGKTDPNAPKRPLSSYFRFCQANRERVTQETGLSAFALAPELSNRWKALNETQKEKWNEGARKDMAGWKKQMIAYKQTEEYKTFTQTKKLKKLGKRPTDKNAPKRPSTPYFLFMNEYRDQVKQNNPSIKITEMQKELGKMWKNLSQAKKNEYEANAKTAKKSYTEAMDAYKNTAACKVHMDNVNEWLLKKRKVTGLYQREQEREKAKKKASGQKKRMKEIVKKKKEAAKKKATEKKKIMKLKKKKQKAREVKKAKKVEKKKTLKGKKKTATKKNMMKIVI